MKILLVHNFYQQDGGEDEVFRREKELLSAAGHEVVEYTRHNDEISRYGALQKITLAGRTIWAGDTHKEFRDLLRKESPDVAHFHNTFPLVSPSAYYACASAGVPVVQTLHNSRLICPGGALYRDAKPCDDCVGKALPFAGVRHACYQDSYARSAVTASMLVAHRALGTWETKVDQYVVFTEFYRQLFIRGGIAGDRITLKPHFVECDPGVRQQPGNYALFVGRLAPEKGIKTLLSAWQSLPDVPLKIRGEGPLADSVQEAAAAQGSSVTFVPRPSRKDLFKLMQGARFLVWPSEGYNETFGLVAVEAFACGVPVIASNVGAMKEIVTDRVTGLHFRPADPADLEQKVRWAWTHPTEMEEMGRAARREFEVKYTKERNYTALMNIYERVREGRLSTHAALAHVATD
jgi:glycosyltransferase involved in cell wall biosynthesis